MATAGSNIKRSMAHFRFANLTDQKVSFPWVNDLYNEFLEHSRPQDDKAHHRGHQGLNTFYPTPLSQGAGSSCTKKMMSNRHEAW